MNNFKKISSKEKAEHIALSVLYPFLMLFRFLGKSLKLFGTRKRQLIAGILTVAMVLTTLPLSAISVFAQGTTHSVTLIGGDNGVLKKGGIPVQSNIATFNVTDGGALDAAMTQQGYTLEPNQSYALKDLEIKAKAKVVDVKAGKAHTIALLSDGTVWATGDNFNGQLGDGTSRFGSEKTTFVQMKDGASSFITDVKTIAAGSYHTVVLKEDGTVWAVGFNGYGQLGDGTTYDRTTFVQMKDGTSSYITGVKEIGAGYTHTVALKDDGTVWAVGFNKFGQLGDGTSGTDKYTTSFTQMKDGVGVSDFIKDVKSISVADFYTVALKIDGTVWAVGENYFGQLGDGTSGDINNKTTFVQMKDGAGDSAFIKDVTAIAAGSYHTVVLKTDDTVWATGYNKFGQLGDGTEVDKTTFVQMKDGTGETEFITDIKAISAGGEHTVALKNDNTVWAVGANDDGQLGNGTNENKTTFVQMKDGNGFITDVLTISAGGEYTVALKNDSTVLTVGANGDGQLGNGTKENKNFFVQSDTSMFVTIASASLPADIKVTNDITVTANYKKIAHSVTLNGGTNGTLKKGGTPVDGNTTSFSVKDGYPLDEAMTQQDYTLEPNKGYALKDLEVMAKAKVVDVKAGDSHTVALLSDGTIWAVGANDDGQLGDGTDGYDNKKTTFVQMKDGASSYITGVKAIAAGDDHTVALKTDGTVWAVGDNGYGQLGNGTNGENNNKNTFVQMKDGADNFITGVNAIAAGGFHTVALKNDGTVWAVGNNSCGQLGDATEVDKNTFIQMKDGASSYITNVKAITVGHVHTVALKEDNTVWAVGLNDCGQLGDGTSGEDNYKNTFVQMKDGVGVSAFIKDVTAITAGSYHTVALKKDGTAWSVGDNIFGQLGDGTSGEDNYKTTFVQMKDGTSSYITDVKAITAGDGQTVALKEDGTIWAVGDNIYGQLGDGTSGENNYKTTFAQMKDSADNFITGVMAITAGYYHTIVLKADGTVWSVGMNNYGQLGNGTTDDKTIFVQSDISMFVNTITTLVSSFADIKVTSDMTVTANYEEVIHSVTLNGGTNGTLKNDDNAVVGNTASFNVKDGYTLDEAMTQQGYTLEPNQGYSLKDLEVKAKAKIVDVKAGGAHTVALLSDGTVWAVGYNHLGQLGDGTNEDQTTFIQMKDDDDNFITGIKAIATGYSHTVALKDDGTVWAVGYNRFGQLGDGTSGNNNYKNTFVQMKDGASSFITGVKVIAAGFEHTVVLKTDGTVWATGRNSYGQLGDGTMKYKATFVQMKDGADNFITDVKAIAASYGHTVALKKDGTVWATGYNSYGQLGDGTNGEGNYKTTFVQMMDGNTGITEVTAISAGGGHTVVLKKDGTVWAIGYNRYGQLGDGTEVDKTTFVQMKDGASSFITGVKTIAIGGNYTVALKTDGTVWSVGDNEYGQLGNGTNGEINYKTTFVQMKDGADNFITGVKIIATSYDHTVALKESGAVWAVGSNDSGQLGDGTMDDKTIFIQSDTSMFDKTSSATSLADIKVTSDMTVTANYEEIIHSVTLNGGTSGTLKKDDDAVTGNTAIFNVTDGDTLYEAMVQQGYTLEPNQGYSLKDLEVKAKAKIVDVNAGGAHTVALLSDGTVWAVGDNSYGQLGNGTGGYGNKKTTFVQMRDNKGVITDVIAISAGLDHTVVLKKDGTVWAVGNNRYGQLGDGTNDNKTTFVQMNYSNTNVGITEVTSISAGSNYTVVLKKDGTVWSVGENSYGQLGDGTNDDKNTFVQMKDSNTNVGITEATAISAGSDHTVVLKKDGTVWAVGDNLSGQLGDGTYDDKNTFVQMMDSNTKVGITKVTAISAGGGHTVVLKTDGTVWSVGWNDYGQLGDGTFDKKTTFVQTLITNVTAISAADFHTVALKTDGTVWAAGNNGYGQLGDGTSGEINNKSTFVQMKDDKGAIKGVKSITTGVSHTTALKDDGTVWAVGLNYNGQLGNGTMDDKTIFVQSDTSMFDKTSSASSLADIVVTSDMTVTGIYSKKTTLSLETSKTELTYGENIVLTATLTYVDSQGGKFVKFYEGETLLATVETDENGIVTYTVNKPSAKGYSYKAVFEADGTNKKAESNAVSCTVNPKVLAKSDLTVTGIEKQIYTGSQITPVPTVKFGNITLAANTDYTLVYGDNKDIGKNTGSVTIKFMNNYSGTVSTEFTIEAKPGDADSPQTGDTNNLLLWICMLISSGAALALFGISKKRKNIDNRKC